MPRHLPDRRHALTGLAALALLGGCASSRATDADASRGTTGDEEIDLSQLRGKTLRVVPKDGAMTMDYRPDRLTIIVDEDEKIERAYVG